MLMDGLNDEEKKYVAAHGWKTVADLLKSYRHLEVAHTKKNRLIKQIKDTLEDDKRKPNTNSNWGIRPSNTE
jgi:hypothetical protein